MSGITFEWDSRDLQVFRGGAVEKALARAMRLAGNQALKSLQQGTTDLVKRQKNLPLLTITEDQQQRKPSRSAELRDFAWTLFIKGQPVPLTRFPYIDTRRLRSGNGVLVRFGTGGTQRISGAFQARMRSGHLGIFKRTRKTSLPIEELFSYRLPADLGGEVMTTLADPTYRKLEASWRRGLDRELGKLRRKGAL